MLERLPISKDRSSNMLSIHPSFLVVLISCAFSLLFSYLSYQSLHHSQSAQKAHYQSELSVAQLQQRFDQLTLMANRYTLTGEVAYLYFYHELLDVNNERQRHNKYDYHIYWQLLISENRIIPISDEIKKLYQQLIETLHLPNDEMALLLQAKKGMSQLFFAESKAFSEIDKRELDDKNYLLSEMRQRAIAVLFSESYLLEQVNIKELINKLFELQKLRRFTELQVRESQHAMMVLVTLICFLCLITSLFYNFYKQSKNKVLFAKALRSEVSNRTLELFEKREQLKVVINEMELTKNQLVESEKMASLGNLVSGIAHEVNTPLGLSVTLGSHLQDETKTLLEKIKTGELKRSDLDHYCAETIQNCTLLQSNLERAANLISSFKQVAVDRSSDELRSFKMSEYIDEVILSLRPRLKKTEIEIEKNVLPNEPFLISYPGAVAQVVTNVVMNSVIHAFNNGTEKGNISFTFLVKDEDMLLTIQDNGKGMPAEVLDKIFEPFFTTERGNGGSGLGMHIVYNLVVHRLGGTIKCKSKLGEGTIFFFCFPIKINQ